MMRIKSIILPAAIVAICFFATSLAFGEVIIPPAPGQPLEADYLVFVHEQLDCPAVQQLITLRQNQGRKVKKFSVVDGMSRETIKNNIINYYENSIILPLFVILIGDAADSTADAQYARADAGNFIPTYQLGDNCRPFTDDIYVCVDPPEDLVHPDLYIGRIPATTQQEVTDYIGKLASYEGSTTYQAWKNDYLIVAGDNDRGGFPNYPPPMEIRQLADQVNSFVSSYTWDTQILYQTGEENELARKYAFCGAVNAGKLIVTAFGTGAQWDDFVEYIWRKPPHVVFDSYTDLFNTGKYPMIFGISCDLGDFDPFHYTGNSYFYRNFVLPGYGGAIGYLAPAGWTNQSTDAEYIGKINSEIFQNRVTDIGRLVLKAKEAAWNTGFVVNDNIRSLILFADPALRLSTNPGFVPNFSISSFELSDRTPYQDKVQAYSGFIFPGPSAAVYPQSLGGHVHDGMRSYRVNCMDASASNTNCYWQVYPLDYLVVGPSSRYLSFWIYIEQAPTNPGHVCIDALDKSGVYLHDYSKAGYICDQYGTRIGPFTHTSPVGQWKYYVFDLNRYPGATLSSLLVGYDDGMPNEAGQVTAYIDEVRISGAWGYCPEIVDIGGVDSVASGGGLPMTVIADDPDFLVGVGDSLSYFWSASIGEFTNRELSSVVYHPGQAGTDTTAILSVTVSDRGNNSVCETLSVRIIAQHLKSRGYSELSVSNYPNPFNARTIIRFDSGTSGSFEIKIYDITGRLVDVIWQADASGGPQEINWAGIDRLGKEVPSGVYYYRVSTSSGSTAKGKMILLR
jgi:hypothetical protein